jgi:hypothetical protein
VKTSNARFEARRAPRRSAEGYTKQEDGVCARGDGRACGSRKHIALDLILAVMREPHVALGQRVKMALKALPHVHAKAKAGHPSKLSEAKLDNGSSSPAHVNANARTATEKVDQELRPLDFLQSVIRDAKTPAALQIKVAQAILPYIRPKRSVRPKRSAIGADQYGFAADRELARKLRNKVARILQLSRRQNLSPADKKLFVRLSQEIKLMAAALPCPCPSRYSSQNAGADGRRMRGYGANAGRAENSAQWRMPNLPTSMRAIGLSCQARKCRAAPGWPN